MEIERLRLQYEITKAQLLYEVTPARLNISVKRGQVDIQHEPLKLTIENQSFDSVGIKADTPREQAQSGKAVLDAAGRYAREKSAASDPGAANSPEAAAFEAAQREVSPRAPQRPEDDLERRQGDDRGGAGRDQRGLGSAEHRLTYIPYSVEFYIDKW